MVKMLHQLRSWHEIARKASLNVLSISQGNGLSLPGEPNLHGGSSQPANHHRAVELKLERTNRNGCIQRRTT